MKDKILSANRPTACVNIDKELHARMRIHVAKHQMKIKVWLETIINKAIKAGE